MILTAMSIVVLGQLPVPARELSLEQAKAAARFIVVAEVGKTSERRHIEPVGLSDYLWTELKPSAMLKGEVTYEELNRHPLAIWTGRLERLPRTGDELIFFLGDNSGDIVVIWFLPKTEANLAAIRSKAPPGVGPGPDEPDPDWPPLGGIGGGATTGLGVGVPGGGSSHELRRRRLVVPKMEPPPYRGTKIVTDAAATGEALRIQQEFAAALSRADPIPESRRAHFAWIDKDECVRRYRMTRLGWYGGIRSVEPRPGGGWVVRIVIRPWLYIPFRGLLRDEVEETYDYVEGRLRLTRSDAAEARPEWQTFSRF